MAVKVRLTRVGSKKNPIWRVVVADGRSPRDGRNIETIGHYNPQTQPSRIEIDRERLQHWLDRGAQPSNTVKKLMRAENTGLAMPDRPAPPPPPARTAEPETPEPEAAAPEAAADTAEAEAPSAESEAEAPAAEEPADVPEAETAGETDAAGEADASADAGDDS